MHETAQRLLEIGLEQGAKDFTDIARTFNASDQSATNWKARGVPLKIITEASSEYGVAIDYLLHGKLPKYIAPIESHPRRVGIADPGDESLAHVRRVQFKISAGITGFTVEPIEDERPPIYFRKDWCAKNNYDPDKLVAILVNGDSMVPCLFHGDLVVINTADTQPRDGEVFAVNNEGEPIIKRLRRDGSDWWLDSDAADQLRFRPRRCGEGCSMIGRVIYKQSDRI